MKYIDILGWIGVACILFAYALVSFEVIFAKDATYQLLNIIGAIGIIASSLAKKDYQPVALNIIWLIIATISITVVIL